MPEAGDTLGPYSILSRIGAGGMGEVYLAHDPRLDRDVALKVLPEELRDDPERRQRFLREARAAAQLSHPNITAIHEVGEAEGRDYIAFEYVEGRPLDEVLREGPMSLADLVELALPLADALSYAHERGVVHRDLKAANVMVSSRGHAKLLDFGLAKLVNDGPAEGKEKSTTLTLHGAVFGTPQAMSPEQALGRPVDARSDVFSFGSLLYEMASGRSAFDGKTVMEVMNAVIQAAPPDLLGLRRDLPPEFAEIVAHAMRKDPAERYPTMAGLVADLRHFKRKTESGLVPPASHRKRVLAPAVVVTLAAVVVALVWVLRSGGAASGTAGATGSASSIAVVGFSIQGSGASESLDLALASLVTAALAQSEGLDVTSTSKVVASLRQAGQEAGSAFDPALAEEAARLAKVETYLSGSVLARAGGLTLTAELVEVERGTTLGVLRREVASEEELFELAEALAEDVRELLGLGAASANDYDLTDGLTASTDAYLSYVAGEVALMQGRFDEARRHLRQATEIDPKFAMAHVRYGMANEWEGDPETALAAYEEGLVHAGRLPSPWERIVRIYVDYNRGNLDRALADARELEREGPPMAEVHNVIGEILQHSTCHRDVAESLRAFQRALEIDPNFLIVLYHITYHCIEFGSTDPLEVLLADLRESRANPEGIAYVEIVLMLSRREYRAAVERIEAADLEESRVEQYLWALFALRDLERVRTTLESRTVPPGSNADRNRLNSLGDLALFEGRLEDALDTFVASGEAMAPRPYEGGLPWYAPNLAWAKHKAARAARLLGRDERAYELLGEAVEVDPPDGVAPYWRVRWLAEDGRLEEARAEAERYAAATAGCDSRHASAYGILQEIELALATGDVEGATGALRRLEGRPAEELPLTEFGIVRMRVARAAGDPALELAAARAAYEIVTSLPEEATDLQLPLLHALADAEDRAGETEAAREHGRELVQLWKDVTTPIDLLEDARRRWGE